MRPIILLLLSLFSWYASAQNKPLPEKYQPLRLGEVKPTGWIKAQMLQDLRGFSGNLDQLVPDLIRKDDIYGKDRLT